GDTLSVTTSGDASVGTVSDDGNGVYTATITASTTAGAQTITATDASVSGQASLTQVPGAATSLTLSGLSSGVAGDAQSVTVTAHDAAGNVASGYTGSVGFTSTDTNASLPAG